MKLTTFFLSLLLLFTGASVGAASSFLYMTNRAEAFAFAENENRKIILYTGRATFCPSNDPRGYFFDFIVPNHPQLVPRAKEYVVCEQFMFAPSVDFSDRQFVDEYNRDEGLYKKYYIGVFYPTVTVLDSKGNKLNGPFRRTMSDTKARYEFVASDDDCYESLREYASVEVPLTVEQAQSNLVAVLIRTGGGTNTVGLFKCVRHPEGGQPPVLLESGTYSTKYQVGLPFEFRVRQGGIRRGEFSAGYVESMVTVVGAFTDVEPFEGSAFIKFNDAYFTASIKSVGSGVDHFRIVGGVGVLKGEYAIMVHLRSREIAEVLLKELKSRYGIKEKPAE